MGHMDRARTYIDRRTDDLGDTEVLEPDDRTDNVHQGVHRADLVEVDPVGGSAVDLRFDLGQPMEDGQALLLNYRGEGRAIDDAADVRKVAGRLFFLIQDDMDLCGRDARPPYLLARERITGEVKLRELRAQNLKGKPCVHEGAQGHVAGDAGKTVEVG